MHDWAAGAAKPGVCFTNVSRALQDILLKFVYCRNRSSYENFKLKLCTCAQSMALGTRTKFQFEILTINVISSIVYFREIILDSSRNVSDNWPSQLTKDCQPSDCTEEHYVSLPGMEHMSVELRKMYGYSYIWHNTERCQIGWSILLFIFISELIFD